MNRNGSHGAQSVQDDLESNSDTFRLSKFEQLYNNCQIYYEDLKTKILPQKAENVDRHLKLSDGTTRDYNGRLIVINKSSVNESAKFVTNYVSTTHYTWWNFIPKNLFEQFRRIANFYFLVCAILTVLPLSPYEPYSSIIPLLFVLSVSALREAIEDSARYKSDKETNNRKATVLRNSKFVSVQWAQLRVGEIIRVESDETLPADIVCLSSSEESGLCYVQTANLDGETNLKVKCAMGFSQSCSNEEDLLALSGDILAEPPSNDLYRFHGQLINKGTTYPITADNLLLRGCNLQNTKYVYGLIIYTGNETRIEMNAAKAPAKQSLIEKNMNTQIFRILIIQFILCFIAAIIYGTTRAKKQDGQWFTATDSSIPEASAENWLTWIILLNVMLPISLYVTLEIVKVFQGFFMSWDVEMYYAPTKKGCEVRSVGLNEDLGQISHVFSDKTGTLTRNEMVFMKGSVNGISFDYFDSNNNPVPCFQTYLESFKNNNKNNNNNENTENLSEKEKMEMFLLNLAICNSVLPELVVDESDNPKVKYLSPSPDEEALVTAAATNGYKLIQRTATTASVLITDLENKNEPVENIFEVLRVLEFTSERKRMSVILKTPQNKILLLTKGADTEIQKRLSPNSNKLLMEKTAEHLVEYACDGLRTLVLGYNYLTQEKYDEWNQRYDEASVALKDRELLVEEANNLIEQNVYLLGATAIEDKLQDGVPEALVHLRKAGVKVWVLTGDKQETAINIGNSSGLLTNEMHIFTFKSLNDDELNQNGIIAEQKMGRPETVEEKKERIAAQGKEHTRMCYLNALNFFKENELKGSANPEYALVLDSETLKWSLDRTRKPSLLKKFLKLSSICRSVLLCRCSPLQKAQVVKTIKLYGAPVEGVKPVTLAIGDGANDVGMIKEAHIGIGISGKEGMQACQNSDYSISQFRFLRRLMLIHGRWNYRRISLLVVYSFYKNITLVITQFLFGLQSEFTGQTIFDGLAGNTYNVFYTSGILVTAIFDQDVSQRILNAQPELYRSGVRNEKFNSKVFWKWWIEGLINSGILYLMIVYLSAEQITHQNGYMLGMDVTGMTVFTTAVVIVNVRLAIANNYWNWINWLFFWGSIFLWFVFGLFYSSDAGTVLTYTAYWIFMVMLETAHFWLLLFFLAITCNLAIWIKMGAQRFEKPSWKQQLKISESRGEKLPGEQSQSSGPQQIQRVRSSPLLIDVAHQNKHIHHSGYVDQENKSSLPFALGRVRHVAKKGLQAVAGLRKRPDPSASHRNDQNKKAEVELSVQNTSSNK